MKFNLIIDKVKEEEVTVTVHERSALTEQIEALVKQHTGTDRITAFAEDEMKQLSFADIGSLFGKTQNWACVTYHRAKQKIQDAMEVQK